MKRWTRVVAMVAAVLVGVGLGQGLVGLVERAPRLVTVALGGVAPAVALVAVPAVGLVRERVSRGR